MSSPTDVPVLPVQRRRAAPAHRAPGPVEAPPSLGGLLNAAMVRRGWTLGQLCEAIEIPSQHVSAVLRGDWACSARIAARAEYVLASPGLAEQMLVAQALAEVADARAEVEEAVQALRAADREAAARDAEDEDPLADLRLALL